MNLTAEQACEVFERTGSRINSACDACGRILGAVRWTIRGESGEWCSRECREPQLPEKWQARRAHGEAGTLLARKHTTLAERMASRRESKRACAERRRQRFASLQV